MTIRRKCEKMYSASLRMDGNTRSQSRICYQSRRSRFEKDVYELARLCFVMASQRLRDARAWSDAEPSAQRRIGEGNSGARASRLLRSHKPAKSAHFPPRYSTMSEVDSLESIDSATERLIQNLYDNRCVFCLDKLVEE